MAIDLPPRVRRCIGFAASGVYYLDLDSERTMVIYDPEHIETYDNRVQLFREVYTTYGRVQNIYIEE